MAGTVTANIDESAEVFVGEDKQLVWTVTTDGTTVQPIVGWTFNFELRLSPYHPTTVLAKTGSILNAPGTDGKAQVVFASADTKNLKAGTYWYGLARTNAGSWDVVADGEFVLRKSGVHAP